MVGWEWEDTERDLPSAALLFKLSQRPELGCLNPGASNLLRISSHLGTRAHGTGPPSTVAQAY